MGYEGVVRRDELWSIWGDETGFSPATVDPYGHYMFLMYITCIHSFIRLLSSHGATACRSHFGSAAISNE